MFAKSSYSILAFSLVIIFNLFISSAKSQEEDEIDFSTVRDGIVHIGVRIDSTGKEYKWLGTGFAVDSACTFVTAKHVIRNVSSERIVVRFQIPKNRMTVRTFPARIIYKHNSKDIAFLRIDTIRGHPCKSGDLHILRMYNKVLAGELTGKEVLIVGYPKISGDVFDIPIVRQGIISSTEISWSGEPMILLDLQGVPGFSGSPVVLKETGEVVGIVFGPGPTKRIFGFEWATPISPADYNIAVEYDKSQN